MSRDVQVADLMVGPSACPRCGAEYFERCDECGYNGELVKDFSLLLDTRPALSFAAKRDDGGRTLEASRADMRRRARTMGLA